MLKKTTAAFVAAAMLSSAALAAPVRPAMSLPSKAVVAGTPLAVQGAQVPSDGRATPERRRRNRLAAIPLFGGLMIGAWITAAVYTTIKLADPKGSPD